MGCITLRYRSAMMVPTVCRYFLNSSSGQVSITRRMDWFRIAEHCRIAASISRAVSLFESMFSIEFWRSWRLALRRTDDGVAARQRPKPTEAENGHAEK